MVEGDEFRKVIRNLLESVRAGKSLSGAMAEYPDVFPKLYVNMVMAGESGGVLESVLRQLNDFMERSLQFREELKTALTYPISLAVVAGLSLIVLFLYVIPKFSLIFEDVRILRHGTGQRFTSTNALEQIAYNFLKFVSLHQIGEDREAAVQGKPCA